jgi:hypothetical protein
VVSQGELRDVDQDLLGVREYVEAFQAVTREANHVGDHAVRQHLAARGALVRLRWRRRGQIRHPRAPERDGGRALGEDDGKAGAVVHGRRVGDRGARDTIMPISPMRSAVMRKPGTGRRSPSRRLWSA